MIDENIDFSTALVTMGKQWEELGKQRKELLKQAEERKNMRPATIGKIRTSVTDVITTATNIKAEDIG